MIFKIKNDKENEFRRFFSVLHKTIKLKTWLCYRYVYIIVSARAVHARIIIIFYAACNKIIKISRVSVILFSFPVPTPSPWKREYFGNIKTNKKTKQTHTKNMLNRTIRCIEARTGAHYDTLLFKNHQSTG